MKHIQRYSDFDKINEDFIVPAALILLLIKIMRDNTRTKYESPYKTLDKKHLSTAQDNIEVPWYKFGKSKQEFIEMEKEMRPKIVSERERVRKETFEFETNTVVYDFMKNPNVSPEDQKEIDTLNMRMNQMHIQTSKKEMLIKRVVDIYMKELRKKFPKLAHKSGVELRNTYWGPLRPNISSKEDFYLNVFDKMKNILRGKSDDPRLTDKIDIESYKPVKPTPIEPKLLKKIEEYELGMKELDDEREREEERGREEAKEKDRLSKLPKENDVKALNDFVNKYFENESARVYSENKEEIEKIKSRIKPGIGMNKKMGLCYKILKIYWVDLSNKTDLGTVLKGLDNLSSEEARSIILGSLYYKIELNKLMGISSSGSIKSEAEQVQSFLTMANDNIYYKR
jgi:hypothetical protein